MVRITTAVLAQKLDDFIEYQKETNNEIRDDLKTIKHEVNGNLKALNNRCIINRECNLKQDEAIKQLFHITKKKGDGLLKTIINLLK